MKLETLERHKNYRLVRYVSKDGTPVAWEACRINEGRSMDYVRRPSEEEARIEFRKMISDDALSDTTSKEYAVWMADVWRKNAERNLSLTEVFESL